MSRVEEALRGPAPSLRPRPGRSGRGLGAGLGWRRRRSPTYLLAARRGGLGPAAQLPAPFPTLAKERNTPHLSLFPFDLSNSHF